MDIVAVVIVMPGVVYVFIFFSWGGGAAMVDGG